MRKRSMAFFAMGLSGLFGATWSPGVHAQENETRAVPAPSNAFELQVGTGYTQGWGNLFPAQDIEDIAGAGIGVGGAFGYRANPWMSVDAEGQYQQYHAENSSSSNGITANVGVTLHGHPQTRVDPFLRLATGWRWVGQHNPTGQFGFLNTNSTNWFHGWEVAAARIGVDFRASEGVAIAPVVGADLQSFIWENGSSLGTWQWGSFIYGGVQGRLDFGGSKGVYAAKAAPPPPEHTGVTAPQPAPAPPPPPVEQNQQQQPSSPSLNVSPEIVRACEMHLDNIDKAPKFEFDKSDLMPGDYAVLQMVGKCFTTGPMKDVGLRLVGHTDPRGTAQYNEVLGMQRANAVASYLEQQGIASNRIERTSRGKLDAQGTDEATWANDRRVDVLRIDIESVR